MLRTTAAGAGCRSVAALALLLAGACGRGDNSDRLITAATQALRRGDPAEAASLAERGIALTQSAPDSPAAWRFRLLRGDAYLAARNIPEAETIAQAPIPDTPQLGPLRANQQYLRARVALAGGRLPDALKLGIAALEQAPAGSELALDVGGFVGQLRMQSGQWEAGESQLNGVADAAVTSGNRYFEAMARNALGMGKFVRNRCDEALSFFERVASFDDLAGLPVHAKALYNAGMCYARLGQFDRALALQRRAVDATEKRRGSADYEQALGQLGTTYLLQGNRQEGLGYVQRAFTAASESGLAADAALWAGNLAKAYVDLQDWDAAEKFNEEAKRRVASGGGGRGAARAVYTLEYSAAIAAGRGQLDDATRLYEQVLASAGAPPSVLWSAHYGLAHIALARQNPALASQQFESALDVIERTRAGLLKTDFKLSYLTELVDFYREYVSALVAQGQHDRALEVADSSRGRILAERQGAAPPQRATAAAMRRLAAKTGAFYLSYWLTPSQSYVWLISKEGIRFNILPSAPAIERLVRDHQATLANALADPLANGNDQLYRALISTIAPALPKDGSVVIVPDGALHGINFETLPVIGSRAHYWIEDVEIQIAPSLASLTNGGPASPPPPQASVLLIGNPTSNRPQYPALKFASDEMTSIARRFGPSNVTAFDRDRATPAAYRESRPARFGFVHFAAHATANRDSPLDSAVILSGPDTSYKLYARDVAALPLAAELVTVSACRSAGERAYSGEGLIGFAWAFLRAGARRVVAGLWDVDDRSTAVLMERMYDALAAGAPPPRALRSAKLDLLRQGGRLASPYEWGAFELFTVAP